MPNNLQLRHAQKNKKDEFYTQYSTIQKEIGYHTEQFRDKIVYCNCDNPAMSSFWEYFHKNFAVLGLKKLIATYYEPDTELSYAAIYSGGNDCNISAYETMPITGDNDYDAGDFRSNECLNILKESDIICTNPPFSLFRQYMTILADSGKQFLVLGNQNESICKGIFPLFKDNRMWYGASIHSGGIDFRLSDDYNDYTQNVKNAVLKDDGHYYINVSGIRWFTNLDVAYRHDGLWHKDGQMDYAIPHIYYEGNENYYLRYDYFPDVINVRRTKDIPIDYAGVMAVPITWLDKYNPDEFEIVDGCTRYCVLDYWHQNENIRAAHSIGNNINGKATYSRFHIRNLHPVSKQQDQAAVQIYLRSMRQQSSMII